MDSVFAGRSQMGDRPREREVIVEAGIDPGHAQEERHHRADQGKFPP